MAVLCALVLLPALAAVAGGRKWTLSECIDHAARHNISIRTGRLSVMSAGEDVKEAKARLFPSLSFSTIHQGSYRPFAGGSTDKGSYLGDYGLNAAWTVWDGNANRNTLKQQKIVGRQEELNLEENLNSLQEQILQLYVQVLYVGEVVKVDSVILGISRLNAERGAEMYKVGSLSKADLAQLEAQAANDEYNLVNMQGRLEDYKQQLKYLLRLDYDEDFDVAVPPSTDSQAMAPVPTAGEVLANALADRPEIRNALLDIDRSSVGIDIAKAGRMPTVSLSGGIGTNTATGVQGAWAGQMKDNLSGSVGVTLSVLIFLFPPMYGEGYDTISELLNGKFDRIMDTSLFYGLNDTYWGILIFLSLILLFKVFASSATNAGGGCGGIFAPSLYLGCIAGFVFAHAFNYFPFTMYLSEKNFALLGMAGVMSGVMHAPLTGVFLIAELTGGYALFLPLMIVSISSYITIKMFLPHSIYSMRLAQKGELLTHHKDKAVLTLLNTDSVIERDFLSVSPDMTLGDMVKVIARSGRNVFPVVDERGMLLGLVLLDNIRNIMFRPELYSRFHVSKFMVSAPAKIKIGTPMEQIMQLFDDTKAWNLPVVDEDGHYIGFMSKSKIFNSYREILVDNFSGD